MCYGQTSYDDDAIKELKKQLEAKAKEQAKELAQKPKTAKQHSLVVA